LKMVSNCHLTVRPTCWWLKHFPVATLLDLSTLSQAIAHAIQCDNRLFEYRQKRHHELTLTTQRNFASSTIEKSLSLAMLTRPLATSPKDDPM
jgi:hypothetical protein